jgi:replicative superfamily II helicase
MFREFLVYHSSSLEFRAELMTLMMLSDEKIKECEDTLMKQIASEIYLDDESRARILQETIEEFHDKISSNNGLDYNDLIEKISKDIKKSPRFAEKIEIERLDRFRDCMESEDDKIFHDRIIEFLRELKEESGEL